MTPATSLRHEFTIPTWLRIAAACWLIGGPRWAGGALIALAVWDMVLTLLVQLREVGRAAAAKARPAGGDQ